MSRKKWGQFFLVVLATLFFLFLFTLSGGVRPSLGDQKQSDRIEENAGNEHQEPQSSKPGSQSQPESETDQDPNKKDPPQGNGSEEKNDDESENDPEENLGEEGSSQKINGSNDLFGSLPDLNGTLDPSKIPAPEKQEMNGRVIGKLSSQDLDAIMVTLESNDYTCSGKVCINDSLFANTTANKKNTIKIDFERMIMTGTYYYGTEPEVMEHYYDLKTGQGALVNITRRLYCVSNKQKQTMTCYNADSDSSIPSLDDGLAAQYEQEIDRQLNRFS